MDFTKFRTADWLVIVGGAVVFIAGFLDWFDAGPVSPNAFDFTFTGLVPWLLLTAPAVLAFPAPRGALPPGRPRAPLPRRRWRAPIGNAVVADPPRAHRTRCHPRARPPRRRR